MKAIHYGWVIVGVGVLVKMAGLGFGRFAYSMLLPSMRESLSFSYIQMGLLSGGILLGYLLFSFIGGTLATRFGSKKIVIVSLLFSSISMLLLSRFSEFILLLFFTLGMGTGAAGAHISITTLPMAWFGKLTLGRALGIVTGGTGLGVVITGLLIPPLLSSFGKDGWRGCWMLMAFMTFIVSAICFTLLKERPSQINPSPTEFSEEKEIITPTTRGDGISIRSIFVIYFIFGFAYNIYATYFVAFAVEDLQLAEKVAGVIWSIFGWMCMLSGLLWGFLSDRLGRRKALLWNNGLISLSVLIPLLFHQPLLLGTSTFLFGGTFLGTVTIVAASIGDQVGEKRASVYGLVTLIHGIGQFLGTTFGGYLKDLTGSFQLTLMTSLIGFLLCFILTAITPHPTPLPQGEKGG
ncbi:MAG: MFS transporter [Thermodesulfobacteriota bacterium]